MGDRTWVKLKCRKSDVSKIREFIDGPGPPPNWRKDGADDPFTEILSETDQWIEGEMDECNYGLIRELEQIADEQGIPFTGSSGHGGEYGPAVFACDGKRLFHMGASDNGYPYVEIDKDGSLLPNGVMQRIREYYLILEDAERMIEGLPPIPIEMRECAGPCKGPIKSTDSENLCHCCGLYFCDICWDTHDECEPCSDCGQMHITTPCPI